jgi:hypothetical protein
MTEDDMSADTPLAEADAGYPDERSLWEHYAACWSAPAPRRPAWLRQVVTIDVRYRDPDRETHGVDELAGYMNGFAAGFPGHRFRIDRVSAHHGRSIAEWTQLGPAGETVMTGLSVAVHLAGRLTDVTGFFR